MKTLPTNQDKNQKSTHKHDCGVRSNSRLYNSYKHHLPGPSETNGRIKIPKVKTKYERWKKAVKDETYKCSNSKDYFEYMLDSSDSESSESSIDSNTAHQFNKMVDDAIDTGSDEEEIKKIRKWVKKNKPKANKSWYHMPDVSIPNPEPKMKK